MVVCFAPSVLNCLKTLKPKTDRDTPCYLCRFDNFINLSIYQLFLCNTDYPAEAVLFLTPCQNIFHH